MAIEYESVIYVCPIKDHECGDMRESWCSDCPKQQGSRKLKTMYNLAIEQELTGYVTGSIK